MIHRANEIRWCVGGRYGRACTSYGRHIQGCPDEGKPDGRESTCTGCEPRQATDGHLCRTCDTYLRQWLDVTTSDGEPRTNSLLWVHHWLGLSQSARITRAPRWDPGRGGASTDLPSPLSEAVLDCRRLIEDRVYIAEERARSVFDGRPLADTAPFRFDEGVSYLAGKLLRIEDDHDMVTWLYEKLQDSMVTAHMLAPWRAQPTLLAGITCPNCERMSLWIEGGDEHATCRTCHNTVVSKRFDQWVAMLNHGKGA